MILRQTETCQTTSQGYRTFFEYALKIFVVLSTLFYRPAPPGMNEAQVIEFGYQVQELFLRYGVVFLFGCSLLIKPLRRLEMKSLPIFLIYLVVLSCLAGFDLTARRSILNVFMMALFFKIVVEYVNVDNIKTYAKWIFWLLVANLIMCFYQQCWADPIFNHVHASVLAKGFDGRWEAVVGFMRMKANLGIFAAVLSPMLFVLSPWLTLIALPLLWYGYSSSAIAAFIVSVGFLLYFVMKRRLFILLLVGLIAGGAFYVIKKDMPSGQFKERFPIWHLTYSRTLKLNPYIGFGIGSFRKLNVIQKQQNVTQKKQWIWVHNDFIQAFYETGATGLIIILCFIRGRFRDFRDYYKDHITRCLFACFIAILMVTMLNFPWHVGKFAAIFMFLMGLLHAKITETRYEEQGITSSSGTLLN